MTNLRYAHTHNRMAESRGRQKLEAFLDKPEWSQTRLAEILGISQSSVSNWVKGAKPEPHHRKVLAVVAGIPEEDWLDAEERAAVKQALRRFEKTGTEA